MTYTFAKATHKELDEVVEMFREQFKLHHEMNATYYVSDNSEQTQLIHNYVEKMLNEGSPHILVAKIEEKLVGFITFMIETEDYIDTHLKRYGKIMEIYVRKPYRQTGLGKSMMEKAEQYFQAQGCKFSQLAACSINEVAAKFYDHLGYASTVDLRVKSLNI